MRLDTSTCKSIALRALKGKWWKASLTGLGASFLGVFTNLITGVLKLMIFSAILFRLCEGVPFYKGLVFIAVVIIASLWIYVGSVVRLGYIDFNLSLLDRRKASGGALFGANVGWWKCFYLNFLMIVRITVGTVFFLLPGIITAYNYAMAPFILEEVEGVSVYEAMQMSKTKMKGHRWQYFCLRMSFLGWKLLGILTLGIGFFWVNPYYELTKTVFFNEVSGRADALYDRD